MEKLLLFAGIMFLAFTPAQAQTGTLTYATLPNNVAIGSSANFTLSYTSTVPSKVEAGLFIFSVDAAGALTPDWGTWKAGVTVADLPATATSSAQTLKLDIPASVVPSSELPAGKTYVWTLNLKTAADVWITGEQVATTLVAAGTTVVTNNIVYDGTPSATVAAGATVDVKYSYTLAQAGKVKIALSRYKADGSYDADIINKIIDPAAATTATQVAGTASITIPADTAPSSTLATGVTYQWEIAVYTPDWGYLAGAKSPVTVNAVADINKNSVRAFSVYPNPAQDVLNISGRNIASAQLFDITGKMLLNSGAVSTVNVSQLAAGVYFIKVNNSNAIKFIKN